MMLILKLSSYFVSLSISCLCASTMHVWRLDTTGMHPRRIDLAYVEPHQYSSRDHVPQIARWADFELAKPHISPKLYWIVPTMIGTGYNTPYRTGDVATNLSSLVESHQYMTAYDTTRTFQANWPVLTFTRILE